MTYPLETKQIVGMTDELFKANVYIFYIIRQIWTDFSKKIIKSVSNFS